MSDHPGIERASRARWRFRSIWLAPFLALLALGSWSLASPVGSSPDDDYHLASIWCAAGDRTSLCEEGTTAGSRLISSSLLSAACFARDSAASGACQSGTFDNGVLIESTRGNFAGEYPPIYYGTMSLLASDDVQTSVIAMRLLNGGLFVGLLTLLVILLPATRGPTLLVSWLITLIPLGLFLVGSINPSAWAIIGVGTGWIAVLGYMESTGLRRVALAGVALVAATMAVGSRADAAIYLALAIAAVLLLRFRASVSFLREAILPVVILIIAVVAGLSTGQVGAAVNGFGGVASSIPDPSVTSGPIAPFFSGPAAPPELVDTVVTGGSTLGLLFSNLVNTPSLWAGVFGSWALGWFDTEMPYIVALGGVGVFAAVTFAGIAIVSFRKALITAAAVTALWVIPVFTLTRGGDMVGVEVQPRYLLPFIIVLAGFAVLAVDGRVLRLTRLQRILVVGTSIGTQSLALYYTMRRFVTGDDVNGLNLGDGAEWWWVGLPGPMVIWLVGSVAWAALVVIVVRFVTPSAPVVPADQAVTEAER